jgi:energy-coupling factor transporter ATP-binding protein EcfA2
MKISRLKLTNFKRFTELVIEDIPETARLVLLVGSNGSGKSCVFDAFNLLNRRPYKGVPEELPEYHRKDHSVESGIEARFEDGQQLVRFGDKMTGESVQRQFYGRSSNRIPPRIEQVREADVTIRNDKDAPGCFIDDDRRVFTDVLAFTSVIDAALRQPTFEGRQADTVAIFQEHIAPLNESLARIFGGDPATCIQLRGFDNSEAGKPVQLLFTKGSSKIPFDLLSHGEKQVVVLLLGFITRKALYQDTIFYIDEMDLHLNTALQRQLLGEIVEHWIPPSSQLWTASHSLGFIDYAQQSEFAVCIDLDQLDFDQEQTLRPQPRDRLEVFEIAVPKDSLGRLFGNRKMVVCEGEDQKLYNAALDDSELLFIPARNAYSVFQMVTADPSLWGLRDRDFLLQKEVDKLQQAYPHLRILPCYSIESWLYHPENIASLAPKGYDAETWKAEIKRKKPQAHKLEVKHARSHIAELRHHPLAQDASEKDVDEIYTAYSSEDFDAMYRVLPMKTFPKDYLAPFQLTEWALARAPWFRDQLRSLFK